MSAIVRSHTPFICRSTLLKALERIGEPYTIDAGGNIQTSRHDYYGVQTFEFHQGHYVFRHDSSAVNRQYGPVYPWGNLAQSPRMLVPDFLEAVQTAYREICFEEMEALRRAEEERLVAEEAERLRREAEEREAARLAFIQQREQTITERAKAEGFYVKRKEVDGKIRLTLSRIR